MDNGFLPPQKNGQLFQRTKSFKNLVCVQLLSRLKWLISQRIYKNKYRLKIPASIRTMREELTHYDSDRIIIIMKVIFSVSLQLHAK